MDGLCLEDDRKFEPLPSCDFDCANLNAQYVFGDFSREFSPDCVAATPPEAAVATAREGAGQHREGESWNEIEQSWWFQQVDDNLSTVDDRLDHSPENPLASLCANPAAISTKLPLIGTDEGSRNQRAKEQNKRDWATLLTSDRSPLVPRPKDEPEGWPFVIHADDPADEVGQPHKHLRGTVAEGLSKEASARPAALSPASIARPGLGLQMLPTGAANEPALRRSERPRKKPTLLDPAGPAPPPAAASTAPAALRSPSRKKLRNAAIPAPRPSKTTKSDLAHGAPPPSAATSPASSSPSSPPNPSLTATTSAVPSNALPVAEQSDWAKLQKPAILLSTLLTAAASCFKMDGQLYMRFDMFVFVALLIRVCQMGYTRKLRRETFLNGRKKQGDSKGEEEGGKKGEKGWLARHGYTEAQYNTDPAVKALADSEFERIKARDNNPAFQIWCLVKAFLGVAHAGPFDEDWGPIPDEKNECAFPKTVMGTLKKAGVMPFGVLPEGSTREAYGFSFTDYKDSGEQEWVVRVDRTETYGAAYDRKYESVA